MPPGAVATTRMPCSAYSQASDAVSALTPPLAAAYGTRLRPRVATEDTLTITPRPCSSMIGSTRPAAPHRREQRAPDLGLDLRLGVLRVRLGPDRAADVVDQDVDPAEPVAGRGHGRRRAEVALQVGDERDGLRALGGELVRHLVHEVGAVDQGDRGPLPGRPGGHGLAEALRRAGDHDDLVRRSDRGAPCQALFPAASMPARMVALACSLCSTMTARSRSKSPLSKASTMSRWSWVMSPTRSVGERQHLAHVLGDEQLAVRVDQRRVAGGLHREQVERRVGLAEARRVA